MIRARPRGHTALPAAAFAVAVGVTTLTALLFLSSTSSGDGRSGASEHSSDVRLVEATLSPSQSPGTADAPTGSDVPAGWSAIIAGAAGALGAAAGAGGTVAAQKSNNKSAADREESARAYALQVARFEARIADVRAALSALDEVYAAFFDFDSARRAPQARDAERADNMPFDVKPLIRRTGQFQTALAVLGEESLTGVGDRVVSAVKRAVAKPEDVAAGDTVERSVAEARSLLSVRLTKERRSLDNLDDAA